MTPERWQQIKALFETARQQRPDDRAAWLAASCGDDHALRTEVVRLLAADDRAGAFLETPAAAVAGFRDVSAPLAAGTRVGPYEILGRLGEGGMGEVYKGRDARLDRPVAIKLLTPL